MAEGKMPCDKILESDNFFVIKDIHPKTPGHSLVIPKKHYKTLLDIPSTMFNEYFQLVKEAALKLVKENKSEGFNLIMNNFSAAGQAVEHAHLHIIPRKKGDDFKVNV